MTLFPPDANVGDGFEGKTAGPGADVVVLVVIMTVVVVFFAGLRTTSDEIPLGNGCVFAAVSSTSRSISSLKYKYASCFHVEITKTLLVVKPFLAISSVLIPEPTNSKVEISGIPSDKQKTSLPFIEP